MYYKTNTLHIYATDLQDIEEQPMENEEAKKKSWSTFCDKIICREYETM